MGQTEGRAGLEGAVGSWVLEVLEVVLCWRCPLDIQRGYQVGCGIKKKKSLWFREKDQTRDKESSV